MADILATIKGLLSSEVTNQAATQLGESESSVRKALGGLVPLVLGGLISRTETPGGAQAALNLSQQAYTTMGSNLASPGGLLGLLSGSGGSDSGWLSTLFGSTVSTGAITSALGSYAGVSQSSAGSLLQLVGPAVLGVLGQHAVTENLNANGFTALLNGVKGQVQAMMPAGLSSLTGLLGLGGLGAAAAGALGNMAGSVPRPTVPPMPALPTGGSGGSRWPLILLAVAAIAALLYFLRSCDKAKEAPAATTAMPADSTNLRAPAAAVPAPAPADTAKTAPLDAASAALQAGWAKLGALQDLRLPDGTVLKVPANGVEKHLVAFLEDKSKPVDKTTWFSLDRLLFKTASSSLLPASQEQLHNMEAILKAYPAAKLKLGGYTDNRGNEALNLKLSGERAKSVLSDLTAGGVAAGRLASEGYGSAHPVAANATPEGRQQNRRVDVRVTAK